MALNYENKNGFLTGETGYPFGKANNASGPQQLDGSVHDADTRNDLIGFLGAILQESSITPSDTPETADLSQYLIGLKNILSNNMSGLYTNHLFDNAGVLTLTPGFIGINDGDIKSFSIPSNVIINIAGITAGHWGIVELEDSGGTPIFSATELTETDPTAIPVTFKNSWVSAKSGFYITATKRIIGIFYNDATPALAGIVNVSNNSFGYSGKVFINTDQTEYYNIIKTKEYYSCRVEMQINNWNMEADIERNKSHVFGVKYKDFRNISVLIRNDDDTLLLPLNGFLNIADPFLLAGGIGSISSSTISMKRRSGGVFDSTLYNSDPYNRGPITFDVLE